MSTTPTDRTGAEPQSMVGAWVDETGFLVQELLPDGRYDETRDGRPHAYQGRYWVEGNRIEYLDDLGFRASGELRDGVLHHGGYRMTRR
ncbi:MULTISPECIES: Atu4866 domain-containing protein [unclassified Modestobacter]